MPAYPYSSNTSAFCQRTCYGRSSSTCPPQTHRGAVMIARSGFLKARFSVLLLLAGTLIGCEERARRSASDTFELRNHSNSTVPAATQEKAQLVSFQAPKVEPRHIIFEAELNLVVTKLTDTEAQINKVLKQLNG